MYAAQWGDYGPGDGQFDRPAAAVVDTAGHVYVADTQNHRIEKFTANGTFITQWGGSGPGDGQFDQPAGIAVDSAGNV